MTPPVPSVCIVEEAEGLGLQRWALPKWAQFRLRGSAPPPFHLPNESDFAKCKQTYHHQKQMFLANSHPCYCSVTQVCLTVCKPLGFTISRSLLKLMSIELVMPFNHLVLCRPLLLLPSIFPSISLFQGVGFSHQGDFWSFSFSPSVSVLELQLQHQSFQWIFRVDFL